MNYFEFLLQPYNLPFVGAVILGGASWLVRRRRDRRLPLPSGVLLVVSGVAGLTINGAIHDLGLSDFGRRLPMVLLVSVALGFIADRLVRRVGAPGRGREVRFNDPGLRGSPAIVLSRPTAEREAGRARVRNGEGVTHIVRIVADGGPKLRFGTRVTLGTFDAERDAYPVEVA